MYIFTSPRINDSALSKMAGYVACIGGREASPAAAAWMWHRMKWKDHRIPKRERKTEVLLLGVKGLHTKMMTGREKSPPQSLLSSCGWANNIDTDR